MNWLLVLLAQKVVDRLHGIEGAQRHFHEDGVPVAHGTIPETGQLKSLQLLATLRLRGDEAGGLVDELWQIEGIALIVAHGADEIDGVEVSVNIFMYSSLLVSICELSRICSETVPSWL